MNDVFLSLGGNLGDRVANIAAARNELKSRSIKIVKESSVYETEPWGMESSRAFLNKCLQIKTSLTVHGFLSVCLEIENKLGRERNLKSYESRTMDVDVLFFNQDVVSNSLIKIPHPRLHLRKFVLIPLSEISPELQHPIFKKSIQELLEMCEDKSSVTKISTQ